MSTIRLHPQRTRAEQLTVVIPAFNEERGIGATLESLAGEPRLAGATIVVVDDGSTDGTRDVARKHGVTVIRNRTNLGYGATLKKGVQSATTPLVGWFDADGQHRPSDLVDMLDRLYEEDADLVIGARTKDSHMERKRAVGKAVIKIAAEAATGQKIPDVNCGIRIFRREVLNQYLHLLPDGFSASTTSTLLFLKRKYHVVFHPVRVDERLGISSVRQIRDGFRALHTILRILILFNALRSFALFSGIIILAGLAYGIPAALIHGTGLPGMAELAILLGVQVFCLGVVCDQISAIRLEQMERRQAETRESLPDQPNQRAA